MDNPLLETSQRVNRVWQDKLVEVYSEGSEQKPRGQVTKEIINGHYTVPMPAFIDLAARDVRAPFMFAEAAWIISGSNRLVELTEYMKAYANFSDEGIFLRGAYGPKVVDQLPYVVDTLAKDNSSRQAVLTTWRERPGPSKDVPCTVSMQFLIRDDVLHSVVTMRSNDVVLGFTYDVFTFSMVVNAVRLLLKEVHGLDLILGNLHVNAGSLHVYEKHFDKVDEWNNATERDLVLDEMVLDVMKAETYQDLITTLKTMAYTAQHKGDK